MQIIFQEPSAATTLTLGSVMGKVTWKEGWRFAWMGSGALFAVTTGTAMMQLLYVDSWDSQHRVSYVCLN